MDGVVGMAPAAAGDEAGTELDAAVGTDADMGTVLGKGQALAQDAAVAPASALDREPDTTVAAALEVETAGSQRRVRQEPEQGIAWACP